MPVLLFLRALGMGVGSWLSRRSLIELACIALALLAGVQAIRASIDHRSLVKANHRITELTELRKSDRASYEAAQRQAAANNQLQIQSVKRQQEAITNEVKTNLGARLDLIRRELSKGGTAAPQNTPGSPPAGISGPTPCRAYDPAWLCLSPSARLLAAENEERHDELIDWAARQSQIDPNR